MEVKFVLQDAAERGLGASDIQTEAVAGAIADVVIERILSGVGKSGSSIASHAKQWLKAGVANASTSNVIWSLDKYIAEELSYDEQILQSYITAGESEEEAKIHVVKDRLKQAAIDFGVGTIMSGVVDLTKTVTMGNQKKYTVEVDGNENRKSESKSDENKTGRSKGGSVPVVKTQKNVEMPLLPEGSQWERNVLNSFAGGKSTPVTYGGGTTLYRVGGKNGGFWSLDPPPTTEYQWRVDFAIKQEFCNDASTLYKMTIPEGSSLTGLEGTVGTQGMGLYGGAHQVYIDYRAVPSDWIEISPTNWK